jgi:uncharacterized protein (DUF1501 family)
VRLSARAMVSRVLCDAENRDLKPTTDLRAVLKGLLKDHLRADERVLADNVFPGSAAVKPVAGLVG